MSSVLHFIGWWTLLSVMLGPCLAWLLCERNDSAGDETFQTISQNSFQQKSLVE